MIIGSISSTISDWLLAPAVAGAIAALGYVGKLFIDIFLEQREKKQRHLAHLTELGALLKASQASFSSQSKIRDRLYKAIRLRDSTLMKRLEKPGFEAVFNEAWDSMPPEEKKLHNLIRSITIHTIKPLNDETLTWLKDDIYFRGIRKRGGIEAELADKLHQLEVHILLWNAKYTVWIPDSPEHSLVYLDDEEKQGVGFPKGIEALIDRYLGL